MVKQKFSTLLPLKNTEIDNLTDESAFVKVQKSSVEVPAHCWSKKKSESVHIEWHKKNSFTLPTSLLPQGSIAQCQERPYLPTVSPTRNRESLCVCTQLPQLCGMLLKETHFFLNLSRILKCWETSSQGFQQALKRPCYRHHQEAHPQATRGPLPADPPD